MGAEGVESRIATVADIMVVTVLAVDRLLGYRYSISASVENSRPQYSCPRYYMRKMS